ncbi:hypothetical protein [Dyadobacter sp. CY356]|uniref:hypothetical protein n=1 Tax=Dyadobacter sp. CY356 TaxID=2906442 RepID=UPI001F2E9EA9|nr:hypothetical protein [Dyadobacter sp. CY356]MCF0059419.1 hypothetical protein [Dyadobacter sp. CY356]
MSDLKPPRGFYYDDHSEEKPTVKDTLFVFYEIKNYTPSSCRVTLRIPNEGVWAHYFLIKSKDKWTIVKDSTNIYET